MTASISMKAGETFSLDGLYADVDDEPIDVGDYTITSQVRRLPARTLVEDLTVVIDPDQATNTGVFTISATATATAEWPLGSLICDVRLEDGDGVVQYTATFSIVVAQAVTT